MDAFITPRLKGLNDPFNVSQKKIKPNSQGPFVWSSNDCFSFLLQWFLTSVLLFRDSDSDRNTKLKQNYISTFSR